MGQQAWQDRNHDPEPRQLQRRRLLGGFRSFKSVEQIARKCEYRPHTCGASGHFWKHELRHTFCLRAGMVQQPNMAERWPTRSSSARARARALRPSSGTKQHQEGSPAPATEPLNALRIPVPRNLPQARNPKTMPTPHGSQTTALVGPAVLKDASSWSGGSLRRPAPSPVAQPGALAGFEGFGFRFWGSGFKVPGSGFSFECTSQNMLLEPLELLNQGPNLIGFRI